jgi:transposase
MYVATVPNRNSPPAILIRESYRQDGKVKTRTLSNISKLPDHVVKLIDRSLKGESFISKDDDFEKVDSWHHGHVETVLLAMRKLGFERLINGRKCRERDLVVAMVAGRILEPDNEKNSKLANTRWWDITTLPSLLGLDDNVNEDDLYSAMDWLLNHQDKIEARLSRCHLNNGGMVLYDMTSSYFEGVSCPLAARGHNRDGKKGKLQVNYGLLTDKRGCPVSVSVFHGNAKDNETVMSQVDKVREQFNIQEMVLVGDRGMITQKLIDEKLQHLEGIEWITALGSDSIRKLIKEQQVQPELFDKVNLFEITTPDYPDERLVVCCNPELTKQRGYKRQALLNATTEKLKEISSTIEGGKLRGRDKIQKRLENLAKNYKVSKQISFTARDDGFDICINDKRELQQAALDGVLKEFQRVRSSLIRCKLRDEEKIIEKVDKIIEKYNLRDYVTVNITETDIDVHVKTHDGAGESAGKSVLRAIDKVRFLIKSGKYGGQDKIGVRIGKIIDKFKVAKHFNLNIRDGGFDYEIDDDKVTAEAGLDGIYIIRTSLPPEKMSTEDTVRSYKDLSKVERAFRTIKTVDLKIRPIRHHLENRVRAHIFLCMLAYYVEWHMREAWSPLLFNDEDKERKKTQDPIAPAKRSDDAMRKVHTKRLEDGTQVHSFQTLLKNMSQIVLNKCRLRNDNTDESTFEIVTTPNNKQQLAYDLLKAIRV